MLWFGVSRTSWGALQLPLALDAFGMPGCALRVRPDDSSHVAVVGAAGAATFSLTVPADARLLGLEVFAQAGVIDPAANPAGMTVTNGLVLHVGAR